MDKKINLRRTAAIARKESIQILRDMRSLLIVVSMPAMLMLLMGYGISLDQRHVPVCFFDRNASQESRDLLNRFRSSPYFGFVTAAPSFAALTVLDLDHSYESRDLISCFSSGSHFELSATLRDRHQLARLINDGTVSIAIQILPGFAEAVCKGSAVVQVIADGSDSNTALIALGYVAQIAGQYSAEYGQERLLRIAPTLWQRMLSVGFDRRPWYNEDLNSQWFFVPGVIGDLLTVSVLSLAAFGIVRERELGTLEQLLVSPISRFEFILGKTAAPFLIGLCQFAVVMLMARLWFEVPFRGSYGLMLLGSCLYILSILGVAMLLSTISRNQQQALVGTLFFTVPTVFLSGFAFPIGSIPPVMQWFSYLIPLRYFLIIIRASFLKGVGMTVLWPQLGALAATSLALLAISTLGFQKSLD